MINAATRIVIMGMLVVVFGDGEAAVNWMDM
jgi:hypothetical protein